MITEWNSSTSRLAGVSAVLLLLAIGAQVFISGKFLSMRQEAQIVALLNGSKGLNRSELERFRANLRIVAPGSRLYVEDQATEQFTEESTGDPLPSSLSNWAHSCLDSKERSCTRNGMVATSISNGSRETPIVVSADPAVPLGFLSWLSVVPLLLLATLVLAASIVVPWPFKHRPELVLEGRSFSGAEALLGVAAMAPSDPLQSLDQILIGRLAEDLRNRVQMTQVAAAELDNREKMHLEWIAYLSHDLASPLSRMLRRVEAFQYDSEMTLEEKERTAEELHREITELAEIVGSLSQFATLESKTERCLSEVLVQQLLEHAVEDFEYEASAKDIDLRFTATEDLGTARIEQSLVKRAVENLISNAIRHTSEGGEIRVRGYREEGRLDILVEDTGTGLPVQELERIFNFGFRGGETRLSNLGSLGLGLALVKRVAEIHSGTVAASNVEPQGARFVLSLTV